MAFQHWLDLMFLALSLSVCNTESWEYGSGDKARYFNIVMNWKCQRTAKKYCTSLHSGFTTDRYINGNNNYYWVTQKLVIVLIYKK